jgi:hypothetical protein
MCPVKWRVMISTTGVGSVTATGIYLFAVTSSQALSSSQISIQSVRGWVIETEADYSFRSSVEIRIPQKFATSPPVHFHGMILMHMYYSVLTFHLSRVHERLFSSNVLQYIGRILEAYLQNMDRSNSVTNL